MNERIKELTTQNGFIHDHMSVGERNDALKKFEKFAELVVKEVTNIVLHYTDVDEGVAVAKKHFGVEE